MISCPAGVPTYFAYEILRTGKIAFCANPHEPIQFEMGVFKKYTDKALPDEVSKNEADVKTGEGYDRGRIEHLVNYVQEMLNRLQTQGRKGFEEFAEDFQGWVHRYTNSKRC